MAARRIVWLLLSLVAFAGCASVNLTAGFSDVAAGVEERSAKKIVWNQGTELDREAAERLRGLLQRKLTADEAVQIAMLNNRELQAIYADVGVAQADLVQAGLLRNPILDAAVAFHLGPVRPDVQLGVVLGVLDALYVPLRQRVASARFEEAKLRVTGAVLDFVASVRTAFHHHQANEQMLELRGSVLASLGASFEVSRRLHDAGNIADLDLARDRAAMERGKVELRSAEVAARQSRERLNVLMGLSGTETEWQVDPRLPDIPAESLELQDLERSAVTRSIDLGHARQRIVVAGQQLGYDRAAAWIPSMDLGAIAENESDEPWAVGPSIAVPIPLFDQGQARVARARTELGRAQQEYHALAVRVRAAARAALDRMRGAEDRALYYRDILLPLQERIVSEAQLQYNAMQVGIVQLLRDRQQHIETGVAYVAALRDYWLARAELLHILSGRLPAANGFGAGLSSGKASTGGNRNGE